MARVKIQELRGLTADELNQKIKDLKKEIFNLEYQATAGTLEKPYMISIIKKDIARILTILKEMESKNGRKS